jgi:hypothetical protein
VQFIAVAFGLRQFVFVSGLQPPHVESDDALFHHVYEAFGRCSWCLVSASIVVRVCTDNVITIPLRMAFFEIYENEEQVRLLAFF